MIRHGGVVIGGGDGGDDHCDAISLLGFRVGVVFPFSFHSRFRFHFSGFACVLFVLRPSAGTRAATRFRRRSLRQIRVFFGIIIFTTTTTPLPSTSFHIGILIFLLLFPMSHLDVFGSVTRATEQCLAKRHRAGEFLHPLMNAEYMTGQRLFVREFLPADVASVFDVVVQRVFVSFHAGFGLEQFAANGTRKFLFAHARDAVFVDGDVIG